MDECKVIQVIFCSKKRLGEGKSDVDPIRIVTEIFDFDGKLIADNDPERIFTTKDLIDFAAICLNSKITVDEEMRNFKQLSRFINIQR